MTDLAASSLGVREDPRERLLPGGLGRFTFHVGARPPRLVRGFGCTAIDEDGRELIDFHNNFTALLHGHAHPQVTEAAVEAARRGACFGLPSTPELELAEELAARVPCAEQVRFVNSGTEATMSAVRIGRAVTGRDVVVMLSPAYHGTGDPVLAASSATRGIPAGTLADSITVAPNDAAALEAAIEAHRGKVAVVILDLAPALGGCVPLDRAYVERAARLARDEGALVVVDEVISFRHHVAGFAHGHFQLDPDLLTLGKVVGGGFPVGAILGREDVMSALDPSRPDALLHGGTFSANPVTMSAGAVAMRLFDRAACERLYALGEYASRRFGEIARPYGWSTSGVGSVFRLAPVEGETPERRHRLWWAAYANGLLLSSSGTICASTAMDESVVDEAAIRLQASFRSLEDAS